MVAKAFAANGDTDLPKEKRSALNSAARLAGRVLLAAAAMSLVAAGDGMRAHAQVAATAGKRGFVTALGTGFMLDGKPFRVAGVNNHYLTFGTALEVTRVLDDAVAMNANVVRTFVQPVIGSRDGTTVPTIWDWRSRADSSDLGVHGAYMAYWDTERNAMAVNEGPDGLQKLDFLVSEARKRHLYLIIAFLDFWDYTGGAQQMRAWYASQDKNTFFFQDARPKRDYKELVKTLLTRVNPLTGTAYRDEPAILAWDLMNEPYAEPPSLYLSWVAEMSAYVKSIDRNHLVASGHANVDNRMSDLSIDTIDFGTWHGYPLYYNLTVEQFDQLIVEFCNLGAARGKPVLLEEFGYARSNSDYIDAYGKWLNTLAHAPRCAGWLVWRLVSRQANNRYPKDEYDQFDVHRDGGGLWTALQAAAGALSREP